MREMTFGDITPQRKTMSVNAKFGNKGIKKQQGSTVIKYDTLPLDGRTEFRFFEGCQNRNFPFTNSQSEGNKLGVGNSMVVERAYITIVKCETTAPFNPISIATFDLTSPVELLTAEFGFTVANSTVIRNVPLLSWVPNFNKIAENALNSNYEFDTQVVIPPLLEFIATIKTQTYPAERDTFLRLTLEGAGAIIAPKTTF